MQTTAIRTVANSLPENEVILLTLLISKRYIPYTDLRKNPCFLRLLHGKVYRIEYNTTFTKNYPKVVKRDFTLKTNV